MGKADRKKRMRKTKKGKGTSLILAANQLDKPLTAAGIPETFNCGKSSSQQITFKVNHYRIKELPANLFDWIMELMTKNMKQLYATSSWDWNPQDKRKEMTEDLARYLIIFNNETEAPIAFSHFRFDMDYGRPVLYCYEIQVEPAMQSMKLGTQLIKNLETLASSNKIPLVVLTVLLNNPRSVYFFRSLGYAEDETNLTDKSYDYLILSKSIS